MNTRHVLRGRAAARGIVSGSSLAVMALVLLVACSGSDEHAAVPGGPAVRTVLVKPVGQAPLSLRGAVQAGSRLRLGFKQPGIVAAVLVKEGDQVRKGQVLARLSEVDARSQARAAGASRRKAGRDFTQSNHLVNVGAVPKSERDNARSELEAADAALVMALDNLKHTELVSPISGKVVQRLVQPGESIGAGLPALLVDDTENVVVKVGVTDRDLPRLQAGQSVALQSDDAGAPSKGVVSGVAASPGAGDGLYPVEIRPDDQQMRLGAVVTVQFDGARADSVLRIPLNAMVRRQDKDWVFVVEPGADLGIARLRPLSLGHTEGREMTVLSGLKDGDRIITDGAYFLEDGQPVRVLD